MKDLFASVKADLLDRRMRPLVVLVGVALVGAVAFAVLGGGSESATGSGSTAGGSPTGQAPSLAGATSSNPHAATAETTYGKVYQHGSKLVDPFTQLPTPAAKAVTVKSTTSVKPATTSSSSSSGSGSSGGSGEGSSNSSGSGGSGGSTPPAPPKPQLRTVYTVNVEFGKAPSNPSEKPHLVGFKNIKVGDPVPNANDAVATLKSASINSKALSEGSAKASATFQLSPSKAPIVTGPGQCLPSDTQCESLKLQLGQTEELQYLEASGETVTYLLKLTFVFKHTEVRP
jgi:hypothetical protein